MSKYFLGSVGTAEAFRKTSQGMQVAFVSKTLTDSAINVTITKDELRGGTNAPVVCNFFHDPAVAITLTDIIFKAAYVEAQLGTQFKANAAAYKTVTKQSSAQKKITLDETPVAMDILKCDSNANTAFVWVSEAGKENWATVTPNGAEITVDKENTEYCVRYLATSAAAREAIVSSDMIPSELALVITVPLFAGDACSASKGALAGHITFEVPRFQLDGGQEFTFNMSSNTTMNLSGTAMVLTDGCDTNSGKLFRMVEVITGRTIASVDAEKPESEELAAGIKYKDIEVYVIFSDGTVSNYQGATFKESTDGTTFTDVANADTAIGSSIKAFKAVAGGKESDAVVIRD